MTRVMELETQLALAANQRARTMMLMSLFVLAETKNRKRQCLMRRYISRGRYTVGFWVAIVFERDADDSTFSKFKLKP